MPEISDADIAEIKEASVRLARLTHGFKTRYFAEKISLWREPRIKVVRGFRGAGKTTMLLQMQSEKSVYFSMDSPHVKKHRLYDISRRLIREGFTALMIDEIHTYGEWRQETKAIYDEFPSVSLLVSGSAPLAFEPERRYEVINAAPLSLREFLHLKGERLKAHGGWENGGAAISFLARNPSAYSAYSEYMRGGGFPTWFVYGEKTMGSIYHSIRKSIREDSVFFAKMGGEEVNAMEKALLFLATAQLGEFSANSLAGTLCVNKNKIHALVSLLEGMGILRLVRPFGAGSKLVRGDPKLMFSHPNFRSAICAELGVEPDRGALREELAVFCLAGRGYKVSTAKGMKKSPDYIISKGKDIAVVEVGGEGKSRAQLAGFKFRKILITEKQLIPLAMF